MNKKVAIQTGLVILFVTIAQVLFAQQNKQITSNPVEIKWKGIDKVVAPDGKQIKVLNFETAQFSQQNEFLPIHTFKIPIYAANNIESVEVNILEMESLNVEEKAILTRGAEKIQNQIELRYSLGIERKRNFLLGDFVPIIIDPIGGDYKKVTRYSVSYKLSTKTGKRSRIRRTALNSVLASGNWFKYGIEEDGIYKVTYQNLVDNKIISGQIPSESIRLFGRGGGMSPLENREFRYDDLPEVAIQVNDQGDGNFGPGDYFLFYGQSQHRWKYINGKYRHELNYMADVTYYFISINYAFGTAKRITIQANLTPDGVPATKGDFHVFHEKDEHNYVLSGREWFGESFGSIKERKFPFIVPSIDGNEEVIIDLRGASSVTGRSSTLNVSINQTNLGKITFPGISGIYTDDQAKINSKEFKARIGTESFNVNLVYESASVLDEMRLGYISIQGKRKLNYIDQTFFVRNIDRIGSNIQYNMISNGRSLTIWNVTDHNNVQQIQSQSISGGVGFVVDNTELQEIAVFDENALLIPAFKGRVENQNLHALPQAEFLIVTHKDFYSQAEEIKRFHEEYDGMTVNLVTTDQIYNEFSSGAQDITAIKDFSRMFYDRAGKNVDALPKYLLLFGDASYDYKDRLPNNSNFVPSYQSLNSVTPIGSFVTDDYFGFLDTLEGEGLNDLIDLGIGRFPVRNQAEANAMVDKVKRYHDKPNVFGSWRSWVTFVGDDEDSSNHMIQASNLATKIENNYVQYNVKRILFDAFVQETHAGGERYPDVKKAINTALNQGTVLMVYMGHGGEVGWAHERVLGINDILSWDNIDRLSIFLTATCEFSRFDDPKRTSAGELVLLNPKGGGIGMLTTTRLVYSQPNYALSKTFTDHVFDKVNGKTPRFGDLVRVSKQRTGMSRITAINYRNFSLLGDPAIRVPMPDLNIETTSIPDTIKALEKITVKGRVVDETNILQSYFNGVIYPTVFDKELNKVTLDNDGIGAYPYKDQSNVIFKGKASVKNGIFQFSFIPPKDISFEAGKGRISYYSNTDKIDAFGADENFNIGSRSQQPIQDDRGPDISLWMNDTTFVSGGMTNEEPIIFAKLFDENGINTVGSGVGHDIVAVIDEKSADAIVLNDFYEAELDSYQKGVVKYQLSGLKAGKHNLTLKAYDVNNNPSSAVIDFVVAESSELSLAHVLNYPNPFTTNTGFFFEHNLPGQLLDVDIQIYTVSGKLIKQIKRQFQSEGNRIGPIDWDGKDEYGDSIGKGVYIYKLNVHSRSNGFAEKIEKLVILN